MSRNSSRDSRTRSNEEVRRRTVNPEVRGGALGVSQMLGSRSGNLGLQEEEPTDLEGGGREKLKGKASLGR